MKFLHQLLSLTSRTANIVFLTLLLISGLSSKINPSNFSVFGFMGLIYPYLAVVNILFIFSWILRKRLFFIYSLIGLLFTFSQLKSQIALPFLQKDTNLSTDFTVMSYNVRNFDLYNWSKNLHSRQVMMDTIQKYNPDVLLFQEYYTETKKLNNTHYLDSIGYKYHKISTELIKRKDNIWGVAIFSKLPISKSGELLKKSVNNSVGGSYSRGAFADIKVKGQTFRFVNVHLQSLYFNNDEYETIQEITEKKLPAYKRVIDLLKKINQAFIYRGKQVNELKSFISDSPHPIILGGDFNDTPGSYSYQQLTKTLEDSFIRKGKGIGSTYSGNIPLLRIDYILKDKSLTTTKFNKPKNKISDHYPIVVEFAVNPE
ncbi:MAG: endonuclease/exonuclease/phosphatase family protein [Chitinophagales bacterium]|nr:endonuclease/exonuclease/phosphatase family protein [Chitinophagales bacterium]